MISSSVDPSYVLQHIRLRSFAVNFQLINLREVTGEKNDKTATFKISSLMAWWTAVFLIGAEIDQEASSDNCFRLKKYRKRNW